MQFCRYKPRAAVWLIFNPINSNCFSEAVYLQYVSGFRNAGGKGKWLNVSFSQDGKGKSKENCRGSQLWRITGRGFKVSMMIRFAFGYKILLTALKFQWRRAHFQCSFPGTGFWHSDCAFHNLPTSYCAEENEALRLNISYFQSIQSQWLSLWFQTRSIKHIADLVELINTIALRKWRWIVAGL